MPADYASAARALSLPLSPSDDGQDTETQSPRSPGSEPSWAQRPSTSASRRLSTRRPYSRSTASSSGALEPMGTRIMRTSTSLMNNALRLFYRLSPLQRVLFVAGGLIINVLIILTLVYSHKIFSWLGPVAKGWRELPGGWLIIFALTSLVAFPPLMGYSTLLTVSGFVYGFPGGWPVVAAATVLGSLTAFVASRTVFSGYVNSLVGADTRFMALSQVLRHDGLLVLAGIRLCPLPYSLSNGFLATIPSITPTTFALATMMATPKLFVHVFIGSRLAALAESGDEMSGGDKAVNYLSMVVGGILGLSVGLYVYRRVMARARELAAEEAEAAENGEAGLGEPGAGFDDMEEGTLMSPEEADAALMDDDDISLWETEGIEAGGYRDEDDRELRVHANATGTGKR